MKKQIQPWKIDKPKVGLDNLYSKEIEWEPKSYTDMMKYFMDQGMNETGAGFCMMAHAFRDMINFNVYNTDGCYVEKDNLCVKITDGESVIDIEVSLQDVAKAIAEGDTRTNQAGIEP